MLEFTAAAFALGGLAAAAGPVIIHLLNRRRFRVVSWGAMDFLREALQRQRRILQIRELILLTLRMLALVCLGLALARPYFSGSGGILSTLLLALLLSLTLVFAVALFTTRGKSRRMVFAALAGACLAQAVFLGWPVWTRASQSSERIATARVPVHAVFVVDNSRSMGVETAAGTLLDRAKGRVNQFLDTLPPDSRTTLIPMAGSVEPFPQDAFRSSDEARRALDRIRLVDVAGDVTGALEAALEACASVPELPTKRPCVVTDLQATAWQQIDWERWARELPGLQVSPVGGDASNVWIERFDLEDGIAGTEAPSRFLAEVRAAGPHATTVVQATLTVEGIEVSNQLVNLTPGQTRELEFVHQFDVSASGGSEVLLTLHPETQSADQLAADNRTVILAPVVAALPIVFIDQWGDQENVAQGRIGETYALRHLLAPRLANELAPRRLIQSVHVRPEQLTQNVLETARLVVVAGLETPAEIVPLLHEYVVQGGPLMILAGGGFDPEAWNELGWNDGDGILAAPLSPQSIGAVPQESSVPKPFFVDFSTLQHDDFVIAGEDPQMLAGLFNATPFFKAVQADVSQETVEAWEVGATERARDVLQFLGRWDEERRRGSPSDSIANATYRADEERARLLEPNWWSWRSPLPLWDRDLSPEQLVERQQPRVLAWFQGGQTPWAIERRVGAGRTLFWSSGVTSDWNLLRSSSALYVFHRACHRLLEGTLPPRNFQAGDRISLPWSASEDEQYSLERPNGNRERLLFEPVSPNVSGIVVRRPLEAGLYGIHAEATAGAATEPVSRLAVQAAPSESQVETLSYSHLQEALGSTGIRVLGVDEPLHLEGSLRHGQSLWKWCAAAMLLILLLEMGIVAQRPRPGSGRQSASGDQS